MKAIILTYAKVSDEEKAILKETNIFKIALNQHAEEYHPNARIISDYVLPNICKNFSQNIISVRQKLRCDSKRIEYPNIEFKGSTIIAAIEYLISKAYDNILIIGDNTVNSAEFQNSVNNEIKKLNSGINIYQYSNGNFELPVMSITDFIFSISI